MNIAVVAVWFQRWRKPLRDWISSRQMVPAADIDDIVQEVFVRLLTYSDDELIKNPQGYLFRIAANVASEQRERCRNSRPHLAEWLDELLDDDDLQPSAVCEREDRRRFVRAAMKRLPPRQREVLALHVDGLTYKQIADREGITYRMTLRDLQHAYATLRTNYSVDAG